MEIRKQGVLEESEEPEPESEEKNMTALSWRSDLDTWNWRQCVGGHWLEQGATITKVRIHANTVESSWNVMTHGDVGRGMEWVASTLHTTSEHAVSSITTADAHSSAANSRLNWRPHRFKWTRPFRQKTKSGFCACAITFQTQSTWLLRGDYEGAEVFVVTEDSNCFTQVIVRDSFIATCTVWHWIWGTRWPASNKEEQPPPQIATCRASYFSFFLLFFCGKNTLPGINPPSFSIPYMTNVSTNAAGLRTTNDVTLGMWLNFFIWKVTCLQGSQDNTIWTDWQHNLGYIKYTHRIFTYFHANKKIGLGGGAFTAKQDITRPQFLTFLPRKWTFK